MPLLLAKDATADAGVDIIVALAWLSAAAVVLAVAFLVVRRLVLRGEADDGVATGFTLGDLRRLHAEGELTDAQFEQAKAALIARGRAALGASEADTVGPSGMQSNASGLSDDAVSDDDDESSDKSDGGDGLDRGPGSA